MKTITIYELLGLIKDGKAPKNARIRYFDRNNDYYDECNLKENEIINRLHFGNIELNDKVEILEEEKKIPEKLDIYDELQSLLKDNNIDEHNLHKMLKKIELKQNEIIDYLDYLKSKGDE